MVVFVTNRVYVLEFNVYHQPNSNLQVRFFDNAAFILECIVAISALKAFMSLVSVESVDF